MARGAPSVRTSVPTANGDGALAPVALIAATGLVAWWGVWRGAFVFDDQPAIVANAALQAGDIWGAAFGEPHQPLANRPVTCLSLWLDLALFGGGPTGPRLASFLLHVVNAILLFFTMRRTLLAPAFAGRFDAATSRWTALAVAAIWVAHPLAADTVAYATQRSTLLAALFLQLALFAALAESTAPGARRWRALAFVSMALGMATKEDFVVAPLLYVLFERAFVFPSWSAMRPRLGWYGVLATSWLVLALCVALGPSNPTVGFNIRPRITPWEWLFTQAGVVAHYVRLAAWPYPLRGAYGTPILHEPWPAVIPGLFVLALLAVTLACWWRRPHLGWLGALFFLLLAPTSTVLPTQWEVAAERRMYLPMLFVIVPAVMLARRGLAAIGTSRSFGRALVVAAIVALTWRTQERVGVYMDDFAFWTDAYEKRDRESRTPGEGLILTNYASHLWRLGRHDEAVAVIEESIGCHVSAATAVKQAAALFQRGKRDQALGMMRGVLAEEPDNADALGTLGVLLVSAVTAERSAARDPRLGDAERVLRRSLELEPRRPEYWSSLGAVLQTTGRLSEAEEAFRRATELTHQHLQPYQARGEALVRLGRRAELAPMVEGLLGKRPGDVEVRLRVAEWLIAWQEPALAQKALAEALAIDPTNQRATELLRSARR